MDYMGTDHLQTEGFLTAPQSYWMLTEGQRSRICNGAGPRKYGWLVPDSLWGLNCTPCFDIHDYCYQVWKGATLKRVADRLMLDNLCEWIDKNTTGWCSKPLRWMRKRRAYKYYLAVKVGGFWFYD